MKKSLLLLIIFSFAFMLFADDAHVECYGGGAGTVNSDRQYYQLVQDEDIAMTAEHVLITMYEDYYTVDARFWLKNEGEAKTIEIGFPENIWEWHNGRHYLEDFETFVDDEKVQVKRFENPDNDRIELFWYVKQVHFEKNQTRQTRVKYKCPYGVTASGLYFGIDGFFDYIYGTGKSWKGPIGKITVDIKNLATSKYIMQVCFLQKEYGSLDSYGHSDYQPLPEDSFTFKWIAPDTFRLEAENVEPEAAEESVAITIHSFDYEGTGWLTAEGFEGKTAVNARSDFTKAFLRYNLCFFTEKQLRLARNDFYALYGRNFKDKELKSFYESIAGYKVNKNYSDDLLSAEEKEIVNNIIDIENERKIK